MCLLLVCTILPSVSVYYPQLVWSGLHWDSCLFFERVLLVVINAVARAGTVLVALCGTSILDDEAPIMGGAVKWAPSPTPASTTRKQSRTMRSSSSTRKVPWGCCLVVLRSTHHIGSFTWPHWARQSSQSYAKMSFCLIQKSQPWEEIVPSLRASFLLL